MKVELFSSRNLKAAERNSGAVPTPTYRNAPGFRFSQTHTIKQARIYALLVAAALVWGVIPAKAQTDTNSAVQLVLTAEKKVVHPDGQGKLLVSWQPLPNTTPVQPGEVIRYIVSSTNHSDRPVANLIISQPIPKGAQYVLYSAAGSSGAPARITYSIDNGQTFVDRPTIRVNLAGGRVAVRPAPPSAYTNLRWNFVRPIPPATVVKVSYQVEVK